MTTPGEVEFEHSAEPTDAAEHFGSPGGLHVRRDPTDGYVARLDVHAGCGIGDGFSAHRTPGNRSWSVSPGTAAAEAWAPASFTGTG